jgi:hypothetical protein
VQTVREYGDILQKCFQDGFLSTQKFEELDISIGTP